MEKKLIAAACVNAANNDGAMAEILSVCCSLANAGGGDVVVHSLPQSESLILEMQTLIEESFSDRKKISSNPLEDIELLSERGEDFFVLRVAPAGWRDRPVYLNDTPFQAYRYYEGVYFASGRKLLNLMARDAIEPQRDNERVRAPLDSAAVGKYRARLRAARPFPKWDMLGEEDFLERIGVCDCGEMTLAGAAMFGSGGGAKFFFSGEKEISANNIWNFIELALPKILSFSDGSEKCTGALKEAFFNSLIHADYAAGGVEISFDGSHVIFKNSGIPRASERKFSVCRNPRIMRMLRGIGLAADRGLGMEQIRAFCDAQLVPDLENWQTVLSVKVAESAAPAPATEEKASEFYPVVQLKGEEEQIENYESEPQEISELVEMSEPIEISEPEEIPELIEIHEPEPEPTPEIEGYFDPETLPVIVQMVRNNPRTPSVVVREALLDYCKGTFRSLPEISKALLRSETSIKRRYIKPLLSENALEVNERDEYRTVG